MELQCSACSKEIVGVGVVLYDEGEDGPSPMHKDFVSYQGVLPDGEKTEYYLVHPVCFVDTFNEIVRQQSSSIVTLAVSTTADIREALAIP